MDAGQRAAWQAYYFHRVMVAIVGAAVAPAIMILAGFRRDRPGARQRTILSLHDAVKRYRPQ
jgi:hypothetical protein